jgi:hypothetical protein
LAKQLHPEAFVERQEGEKEKTGEPHSLPPGVLPLGSSSLPLATEALSVVEEYACAR